MRKLFLILLTSITIFITINGFAYADNADGLTDASGDIDMTSFPYNIRETSEGFFIELPLPVFRQIIIRANTSKEQLDLCMEEYDVLADTTVPTHVYEDLRHAYGEVASENNVLRKQRNTALYAGGTLLAMSLTYIIIGLTR